MQAASPATPVAAIERNSALTPAVSVIIVSWNTRDLLAEAIASVPPALRDRPVEVIVVDNASSDGSAAMVRARFPDARVIESPVNVGFGAANNLGFGVAAGDYWLLLNSDAALCSGALEALVDDLDRHPQAGAVGAKLVFPDGRFQASYCDFPALRTDLLVLAGLSRPIFGSQYPSYNEAASQVDREVDWVGGACVLLRPAAVTAVGGFDPDFHLYTEETDLMRRLWNSGWPVRFTPHAVCIHHGGQSTAQRAPEQAALLWRSRLEYCRKHQPRWKVAILAVLLRLTYGLRALAWALRAAVSSGDGRKVWIGRASGAAQLAASGDLRNLP